jgi:hypothetical protein
MNDEERLVEKLRRIEALFARPGTEGERIAAERARERIRARLREVEKEDPAIEYKFSLLDERRFWDRQRRSCSSRSNNSGSRPAPGGAPIRRSGRR